MRKRIYNSLDNQKKKENSAITLIFKLIYKFLLNSVITTIVNTIVPLLYSIPLCNQSHLLLYGIMMVGFLLTFNVGHAFANGYRNRSFTKISGHTTMLGYLQSICKVYNERISDKKYIGLFETISDAVCTDIYHFFKDVYHIETRISVVQQYQDDFGTDKCVMISRTSKKTQSLGKKRDDSEVKYNSNKLRHKYYKKILLDNKSEIVVFFEKDIQKHFVFNEETGRKNRKKQSKIRQYVCIPQKVYGSKIAFLFQIDIMEKKGIGETREEVEDFCNSYFEVIMRILQNAYLIESYVMQNK